MRIAILTFDRFNEIDSLVALHMLNRMQAHGWRAEPEFIDHALSVVTPHLDPVPEPA